MFFCPSMKVEVLTFVKFGTPMTFYRKKKKKKKKNIEREIEKREEFFKIFFKIKYIIINININIQQLSTFSLNYYTLCKSLFSFFTLETFVRQYNVKKVS